jgi:Na+/H+-dicarboxylate symporter
VLSVAGYCFMLQELQNGIQPLRSGYTELFYPLKGVFWFYVFGIFLLLVYVINRRVRFPRRLALLGEFSLPVYLMHTVFISYVLPGISETLASFSRIKLFVSMVGFYMTVFCFVFLLNRYRTIFKKGRLRYLGFLLGC